METDIHKQRVYSFFRQHPLMTLSTLSANGVPQAAAVYVYMDPEMNCYCATKGTARKATNVRANGLGVLSTYNENVLTFGEFSGEASIVTDSEVAVKIMQEIQLIVGPRKAEDWVPPMAQLEGDYVVIKIKPKHISLTRYEQSSSENPKPHTVTFDFE